MSPDTQLYLFGSLNKKMAKHHDLPIIFDLGTSTPLVDVLKHFDIPLDRVQLAMVNHKAVGKDSTINPGDRIALFPKEYIVFTDWKDFRF